MAKEHSPKNPPSQPTPKQPTQRPPERREESHEINKGIGRPPSTPKE